MFVVDKVVDEDRRDDLPDRDLSEISLPNGTTKALGPSARDAFAVFEDLCLLANAEKPMFLKLESLRKTFELELIESVLTNYHDLYRKVCNTFSACTCYLTDFLASRASPSPPTPLMPSTAESPLRQAEFSPHTPFHAGCIPAA